MITLEQIASAQKCISDSKKVSPYIEFHNGVLSGMAMMAKGKHNQEAESFIEYIKNIYGDAQTK